MLLDFSGHELNQLAYARASHRRNREELPRIPLRALFQTLQSFRLIQRIDLCRDYDLFARSELGIIRRQLSIDNFIVAHRIAPRRRRHINQVKQQTSALDVTQKTISESMAFMG